MYANNELFDRGGKKRNVREKLPAYAYSRGVELRDDKNPYHHVPSEISTSKINALNISYPINVFEFELPNEEQISCYEQFMMMSNGTIVLNNFLEPQDPQLCVTAIQKKPELVQGQVQKYTEVKTFSSDILPFYKTCFEISKVPVNDSKWKFYLITEHSTELRSELQQIYLHMWLYYSNYMQKVDLGVLDTCNKLMGFGQPVTETERFYLTIRDDYLMASQVLILFKSVLSNQHIVVIKQVIEILEDWKSLIQKMATNPKFYEFSSLNTSLEMTKLLKQLTKSYFKARHFLETCFTVMINQEGFIEKQQIKDDMLCKFWYSMVDSQKL